MKIAMYKGPADGLLHKIGHWFTCLWTSSDYSHCEFVFGEGDALGQSLCASASARDGGVRFKSIDVSSGRWDVFDVESDAAAAYEWFAKHEGAAYDWFGLLWFVLPVRAFNSQRRFFCSEAMAQAAGLPKAHKFHPQKLLEHLKA